MEENNRLDGIVRTFSGEFGGDVFEEAAWIDLNTMRVWIEPEIGGKIVSLDADFSADEVAKMKRAVEEGGIVFPARAFYSSDGSFRIIGLEEEKKEGCYVPMQTMQFVQRVNKEDDGRNREETTESAADA